MIEGRRCDPAAPRSKERRARPAQHRARCQLVVADLAEAWREGFAAPVTDCVERVDASAEASCRIVGQCVAVRCSATRRPGFGTVEYGLREGVVRLARPRG